MFHICKSCAEDYKEKDAAGSVTWFFGQCDWCRQRAMVTMSRIFGILRCNR